MNPWELVSIVAGWGAFVILVFLLSAILFGILRWIYRELKTAKEQRDPLKQFQQDIKPPAE